VTFASTLGLRGGHGRSSTLQRTFDRLGRFHFADTTWLDDGAVEVVCTMHALTPGGVDQLPPPLQAAAPQGTRTGPGGPGEATPAVSARRGLERDGHRTPQAAFGVCDRAGRVTGHLDEGRRPPGPHFGVSPRTPPTQKASPAPKAPTPAALP